jgi:hypothetical protein
VITGQNGEIATELEWNCNEIFDEIVLQQESQVSSHLIAKRFCSYLFSINNEGPCRWPPPIPKTNPKISCFVLALDT